MRKIFLFITLVFFCFIGENFTYGYNNMQKTQDQDNLKEQIVEKNKQLIDSKKIFSLEPNKALKIVEDVLIFALKLEDDYEQYSEKNPIFVNNKHRELCFELQAKAYQTLALFNETKLLFDLATKNIEEARSIYSDDLKTTIPIAISLQYGRILKTSKAYKESLIVYDKIVNQLAAEKEPLLMVNSKNELAELYYILGDEAKAEDLHNEALSLALDNNFTREIIEINSMLGQISERNEEKDKALNYYKVAHEIAGGFGNKDLINREYSNLVRVYQNENEPQVLKTIQSAIEFNSKNNDLKALSGNQMELAEEFAKHNELNKAISSLRASVFSAKKSNALPQLAKGYNELSQLYEKNGKDKLALESYKAFHIVLDSIRSKALREQEVVETFSDELKLVQTKVGLLEDEKSLDKRKIELLKKEKILNRLALDRKNKMTLYLTIGLGLMLLIIIAFIRLNRSRKRANKLLELKSLRTQMNPHFIFNSLNSVNNFISKSDERSANRYLADFSKLLRRVLEYSQDDLISLELEFEIIQLYLKLEHTRFKDKFDYRIEIDSNIDLQSVKIPPMLLQPFIENSIWHGLRYRKDKGELLIVLNELEDCYHIQIIDDGIGRAQSSKLKTKNQKSHKSMALQNINARLAFIKTLYRTKLVVEIENGKDNIGTIVNVKLFK